MKTKIKEKKKPNPGSLPALKLGCICPHYDNHKGKGVLGRFWVNGGCKLHGICEVKINGTRN